MGLFLDKPQTEKESSSGEGNNLKYGYSAMQGWRVEMEDAHSIHVEIPPHLKSTSYFAVLDGHAGEFTSSYSSKCLLDEILRAAFSSDDSKRTDSVSSEKRHRPLENDFSETTVGTSKSEASAEDQTTVLTSQSEASEGDITVAKELSDQEWKTCIRDGFLNLDVKLKELPGYLSGKEKSGSTVVGVFITPTSYVFANCGDSRAVLCRNGDVAFGTLDHKPYNEEEQARIEKAGGTVVVQRVNGSLALSRSLGDFDYKNRPDLPVTEQLVTAVPEVSIVSRNTNEDEFILIACDGIWDVMSNEDAVAFIRARLSVQAELDVICEELLETCLAKGSKDNMSAVLVTFGAAPQVSDEAVKQERILEADLKERVSEAIKEIDSKELPLSRVVRELSTNGLDGLPPGGGLESKYNFIEKTLNELVPDRIEHEANSFLSNLPMVVNMLRNSNSPGAADDNSPPADQDKEST